VSVVRSESTTLFIFQFQHGRHKHALRELERRSRRMPHRPAHRVLLMTVCAMPSRWPAAAGGWG
jgi:hypothetical protein